jgi:hypothetical protein
MSEENNLNELNDNTGPVLAGKSFAEQEAILSEFWAKFEHNVTILPPGFSVLVDEHFWELM